jgi:hypothetical protein
LKRNAWHWAVPVTILLSAGCRHAPKEEAWHAVKADDGSFTASMPGKPEVSHDTVATLSGNVTAHRYVYRTQFANYAVNYFDRPDADGNTPDTLLDGEARETVAALGAKEQQVMRTTVAGFPARNVDVTTDDGAYVFGRICMVGKRMYKLSAVYLEAANKKNVAERGRRFLDSFAPVVK